jgi:Flp pilus assembly protein TadD
VNHAARYLRRVISLNSKGHSMNTKYLAGARTALSLFVVMNLASFAAVQLHAADVETTPAANAQAADYVAGQKWVEAKDWKRAVAAFERATSNDAKSADAWNMLGYSRRWAGDLPGAFAAYDRALAIDPKHRGAHSYLGVAYLRSNDLPKAQAQLIKLDALCSKSCDEYKQLADAIAKYPQK